MCLDGRSRRGIKALAASSNLLFLYAMKMASTPPSTVRTPCLLFSTITPKHWTVLLQCLFDRFGSVFPQCGLMVFPGVVIVSR